MFRDTFHHANHTEGGLWHGIGERPRLSSLTTSQFIYMLEWNLEKDVSCVHILNNTTLLSL